MEDSSKCKMWSEGPQICNVDPKVMPHFSFHARCNYCEETIEFTTDLERELRKHYNTKHRLYCNACKKGDFGSREELDIHLSAVHKDGVCFNCHASFKMASAVAMHVEGPRNGCAVPQTALVNALRCLNQKMHNAAPDQSTVYSPISCCSGNEPTVQELREFRKTLLLAHKKAFYDVQETRTDLPTVQVVSDEVATQLTVLDNPPSEKPTSSTATGCEGGRSSPKEKRMVSQISCNQDETHQRAASLYPAEWTCSTCVDAKFTSLSKLLQHVEQKVRNSWWVSIHQ